MSACDALVEASSLGASAALRAVDCLANQTAAAAFGRLFGSSGAMMPALTAILTLYIAFFAISLLTGRSTVGIAALTPRMMTLGMVLTFATSWLAYQNVVWNLAIGAPDQLSAVLVGAPGSATQWFADRIDLIFDAVTKAASGSGGQASAAQGSFSPTNLTWLASLILLLGTVGVLVTARIALAVLLAVGPVFVVLALFPATRGLFAGWLRGVLLTAITPLFVVVGGSLTVEMLVPVVRHLVGEDGAISGRSAMALFLIAAVHAALMSQVVRIAATMVAGWKVFGAAGSVTREVAATSTAARETAGEAVTASASARVRQVVMTPQSGAMAAPSPQAVVITTRRDIRAGQVHGLSNAMPPPAAPADAGARGRHTFPTRS